MKAFNALVETLLSFMLVIALLAIVQFLIGVADEVAGKRGGVIFSVALVVVAMGMTWWKRYNKS